jgi:hypothetical protein
VSAISELVDSELHRLVSEVLWLAVLYYAGGTLLAWWLREQGLHWSWVWLLAGAGLVLWYLTPVIAVAVLLVSLRAAREGARRQREDLYRGADFAQAARERLGPVQTLGRLIELHRQRSRVDAGVWTINGRLMVGVDGRRLGVSIPAGGRSGSHTLILGATGSGKTVTAAWIAARQVEAGCGAVVVDPKGDGVLEAELAWAARRTGRSLLRWGPEGPLAYNPYASGAVSEIADKALTGERFTEPHYERQAQRYVGIAVKTMRLAGVPVTPASLAFHLDPRELEVCARNLPEEEAPAVHGYLDALTERQVRDLAGIRDRLSILSESDIGPWVNPTNGGGLDLGQAVRERAIVYLRLDSDQRPLLSQMLAGALLSDLITLSASLQAQPVPTVVVIDEFAAIASAHVSRLFARARSAGISLVLCSHELADLASVRRGLREQVLANVSALIAHRQNVPDSAELIAAIAGTKPVWIASELIDGRTGRLARVSRRRERGYEIQPSLVTQLPTGVAVVITPGSQQGPALARIHHPSVARGEGRSSIN